jgi:hypothetical protein
MGLGIRYKTRCDGCGAPMFVKRQDTYVNVKGDVCVYADASVCKKCLKSERRWQKCEADTWELLVDGEPVAELTRDFPGRWGSAGHGWVKDRTKPVFWSLIRDSLPTMRPCKDGSTLAEAKVAAERVLGLV